MDYIFQVYDKMFVYKFLLICLYIFVYCVLYGCKTKNQKTMKAISIFYVIMLMICVMVGSIGALIFCKSWLWVFLSVFPVALVRRILLPKLRMKIPEFPDFSTVLFVLSFAVLVVITTAVTLLMSFKSFLSIMCIVTAWSALLMTVRLIYFIPKGINYSTEEYRING